MSTSVFDYYGSYLYLMYLCLFDIKRNPNQIMWERIVQLIRAEICEIAETVN